MTIEVKIRKPIARTEEALLDSTGRIFNLPGNKGKDLPAVFAVSTDTRIAASNSFNGVAFADSKESCHGNSSWSEFHLP